MDSRAHHLTPLLSNYPDFLRPAFADSLYHTLLATHSWPANHYTVYGRRFELPRLQTWHADPGIVYSFSNNLLATHSWTPLLTALRQQIEDFLQQPFNAVLVNYYRNGNDYVGWHSDDEAELGAEPQIASLSLGAARLFSYRRLDGSDTASVLARHGSLLVMGPGFQQQWQHAVLPEPELQRGRINLTFRQVLPPPGH